MAIVYRARDVSAAVTSVRVDEGAQFDTVTVSSRGVVAGRLVVARRDGRRIARLLISEPILEDAP